ncbi:phosphoribosylglycinamide formyltransferase [Pontibacillus yanchengensis]|uniref:Phosphoribosylglycinamide formyltransferase n=1 Tax=Pontibacillus yanchengensis TaxID=462910 RepID=A0A6I5A799_9BACI|nr:phosphoribosylglycinamide formyltransferase [Pontibacillus yanchengensis]MYL36098.1 phosphoribosylglycinamide formyltransferase [Pontibacillus yanchengensis]
MSNGLTNIAVFASGSGSNFEAIAEEALAGRLPCQVKVLVCDREHAPVKEKAQALGISVFCFRPRDYEQKADFEAEIVRMLQEADVELIALAGYMRLVGSTLLKAYEGRIMNIHPSLLPAFPGKEAVEQAMEANVKVTGVTVHLVDEGMDTGPIIEQEVVRIQTTDDAQSLQKKIQQIEHRLYPAVIQQFVEGEI